VAWGVLDLQSIREAAVVIAWIGYTADNGNGDFFETDLAIYAVDSAD